MTATAETYEFQAEARHVLDLMIHSVYSNRDIFLRELISNSSDALDRRRFAALQQPDLLPEGTELGILIEADPQARTIAVHDNGIGMSRDEVVELIGTIAKSGTKEFARALQQQKRDGSEVSPELIGQFGVGFYSSFLVADRVTLITRKAGEDRATRWESAGEGTYTIEETEKQEAGTTVVVHLKPASDDDDFDTYVSEWKIREIVKRYSDFVAYPIRMDIERTEVERDADGKPVEGAEPKRTATRETLNSMKAIWLRGKDEVSEDEYKEFYKHISHDWNDPLETIRAAIEGTLEYRLLLFIPRHAPFDLYFREGRRGIQLYVKRVFIMDDCKELLPEYLRFVRGVVDSEDLPLNISREILQSSAQIQRMRKGIVGKVLDTLKQLKKNDPETYRTFWGEFGRVLKEGLFQDPDNRDALLDLLLAPSTLGEGLASLQEYVDRMKPGQDTIYYATGENETILAESPHIEAFREKGYEVLFFTDPIDDVWTSSVTRYKDFSLTPVGKGTVELGSEDERKEAEAARKAKEESCGALLKKLGDILSDSVKDVRLSNRLTTSASCLVGDAGDISPQLEQLMRAMNQEVPKTKRILELNPNHPVLDALQAVHSANPDDPSVADYAHLLHGQALLAEGSPVPNPARFSKLLADLMVKAART